MNVSQNVSAIIQSPELAEVVLQAVQAGEMAERQGLANLDSDAVRRQNQVAEAENSGKTSGVDLRAGVRRPLPPARRRARQAPAPAGEEAPPQGPHRIDLVA